MYGEYRSDYVIKDCGNNGIFYIIRFKSRDTDYVYIGTKEKAEKSNGEKLDNNLCRARSKVKEKALCNEWEWFVNLTLDPKKYDRYDLETFQKDLSQWFRNQRKKYKTEFNYLLIPEAHKDGAWHMHGLLNGIPYSEVIDFVPGVHPEKLIKAGYKNFPAYAKKFGYISMGKVRDKVKCAFYISKYITKDLSKRMKDLNNHLHYSTQNLNVYENVAYLNGKIPELDRLLVNHGEFCSTGFVFNESELFSMRFDDDYNFNSKRVVQEVENEKDFLFITDVINDDDLLSLYDSAGD